MKRKAGLILGVTAGVVTLLALWFWQCLPEPLFDAPRSFVATDRHGQLLGARVATDGQWRFPAASTPPDRFTTALIQFEDKRFYSHAGVDGLALLRALYLNLKHGAVRSGGSTLSMQVIRLARHDRARTFKEKIIEMILAVRLELRYSKAEILALYAANAPFGGNVVGVDAAAWRYFRRNAHDLSWAEACTLAVLPNSPALVHPGRQRDTLLAKRNDLLARLQSRGMIDAVSLSVAKQEPLPLAPAPLPSSAPHLLDTLIARNGDTGRQFETTLDTALQQQVQEIVTRHASTLEKQEILNVAALVIDNASFDVVAYVGNSRYENHDGYSVDIIQRPRSTGSVLKPLLYAAMLQEGELTPDTLIPDVPLQYSGYMPENFDRKYRGAVPARLALAQSLNVPAVNMLARHGVGPFYDYLRHMGVSTLYRPPAGYGLSLILGGAEGTLWDLTSLYANLAYLATANHARGELTYRRARLLRAQDTRTTAVSDLDSGAAWLTLQALAEVARPGNDAHWKRYTSARPIAWKTGTSFGQRDAWSIGTTRGYTVGVWVGNANGEGRAGLIGVATAAPIMLEIFQRLPVTPWFAPPTLQLTSVAVCREDGYLATDDCEKISTQIPRGSAFAQVSPNYRRINLDSSGRWRVDSDCEAVATMQAKTWFVLPAGQEYFYRKVHSDYRPLPPWRKDCERSERNPIDLIYPAPRTVLYIPADLGGKRSRTVFEAAHREPDRTLYWHLDDEYLGATTTFHQLALDAAPGAHRLTLVDDQGNRLERAFTVLGSVLAALTE